MDGKIINRTNEEYYDYMSKNDDFNKVDDLLDGYKKFKENVSSEEEEIASSSNNIRPTVSKNPVRRKQHRILDELDDVMPPDKIMGIEKVVIPAPSSLRETTIIEPPNSRQLVEPQQENPQQENPQQENPQQENPQQENPKNPQQENPQQENPSQENPRQENPQFHNQHLTERQKLIQLNRWLNSHPELKDKRISNYLEDVNEKYADGRDYQRSLNELLDRLQIMGTDLPRNLLPPPVRYEENVDVVYRPPQQLENEGPQPQMGRPQQQLEIEGPQPQQAIEPPPQPAIAPEIIFNLIAGLERQQQNLRTDIARLGGEYDIEEDIEAQQPQRQLAIEAPEGQLAIEGAPNSKDIGTQSFMDHFEKAIQVKPEINTQGTQTNPEVKPEMNTQETQTNPEVKPEMNTQGTQTNPEVKPEMNTQETQTINQGINQSTQTGEIGGPEGTLLVNTLPPVGSNQVRETADKRKRTELRNEYDILSNNINDLKKLINNPQNVPTQPSQSNINVSSGSGEGGDCKCEKDDKFNCNFDVCELTLQNLKDIQYIKGFLKGQKGINNNNPMNCNDIINFSKKSILKKGLKSTKEDKDKLENHNNELLYQNNLMKEYLNEVGIKSPVNIRGKKNWKRY
eukprot:Awhi_evm3s7873